MAGHNATSDARRPRDANLGLPAGEGAAYFGLRRSGGRGLRTCGEGALSSGKWSGGVCWREAFSVVVFVYFAG